MRVSYKTKGHGERRSAGPTVEVTTRAMIELEEMFTRGEIDAVTDTIVKGKIMEVQSRASQDDDGAGQDGDPSDVRCPAQRSKAPPTEPRPSSVVLTSSRQVPVIPKARRDMNDRQDQKDLQDKLDIKEGELQEAGSHIMYLEKVSRDGGEPFRGVGPHECGSSWLGGGRKRGTAGGVVSAQGIRPPGVPKDKMMMVGGPVDGPNLDGLPERRDITLACRSYMSPGGSWLVLFV